MERIKNYSFGELYKKLFGKNVRFISDCEFFPNFDVSCKVTNISINKNEIIFNVTVLKNNKKLTIGGNMKNLQFELIS